MKGCYSNHTLVPKPPYNFKWSSLFFGQFQNDVVDVWYPPSLITPRGMYCRVLEVNDQYSLIRVTGKGEADDPRLIVQVVKGNDSPALYHTIAKMLRVNDSLKEFYRRAKEDIVMSRIIERLYGLKPTQTPNVFEMVIIAISEQQISLPAAVTARSKLAKQLGKKINYQGRNYYSFPSAETLADIGRDSLCALSFRPRKAQAIINVAQMQASGGFDFESLHSLSNEEAKQRLINISGLGPWSAEYILARGLGRLDVYPQNDLAVRRAVIYFYGDNNVLTSPKWKGVERYAEYYLLCAYELRNKLNIAQFAEEGG